MRHGVPPVASRWARVRGCALAVLLECVAGPLVTALSGDLGAPVRGEAVTHVRI